MLTNHERAFITSWQPYSLGPYARTSMVRVELETPPCVVGEFFEEYGRLGHGFHQKQVAPNIIPSKKQGSTTTAKEGAPHPLYPGLAAKALTSQNTCNIPDVDIIMQNRTDPLWQSPAR